MKRAPLAAVLAALALVVLSAAMVQLALPSLAIALRVDAARSVWVVTAYQLGLAMALLPAAALGERRGLRAALSAGIALFSLASALCALAPSLLVLLCARWLAGLGGAAVMALAVAQLRALVAPALLPRALAWSTLTVALASAAAPALGAALLAGGSWRALFLGNALLGALVWFAARTLPPHRGTGAPFDAPAALLNAAAFAALVLSATHAVGPHSHRALAWLALAAIALGTLLRRERRASSPMVALDLLSSASFARALVASILCFVGQSSALLALPFVLRLQRPIDSLGIAALLSPWPLGVAVVAPIAARIADRVPAPAQCMLGATTLATGLSALSALSTRGAAWMIALAAALCGVGFGLFQVANNRTLFLSASSARSAAAGALQATARLTGQTAGSLLLALLFASRGAALAPVVALRASVVIVLAAGVASLRRSALR